MQRQIWVFIRANPLPPLVLLGLGADLLARWGFARRGSADALWLATLALGGAPLVWRTLPAMVRADAGSARRW